MMVKKPHEPVVKKRKTVKHLAVVEEKKTADLVVQPESKPIKSQESFILATGKRKTAVARIKMVLGGHGQIVINGKKPEEYFPYFEWQKLIEQPLVLTNLKNKYNLFIKLNGGGVRAQAEAVRLGISRALVKINHDWRKTLKPAGLLSRDARKKERKKPGLKRARRAPQWRKR